MSNINLGGETMSSISHGKTLAADYAEAVANSAYHRHRLDLAWRLLTRFVNLRGAHAYDFGAGEGVFMRRLAAAGAVVDGCDPDPYLLRLAPPGTRHGGVECLRDVPDSSVDLLVALSVIPYLTHEQRATFWREATRIVRPDGHFLQLNPNSIPASQNANYKWVPDPRTFPVILRQNGFEEIGRDFTGYYPKIFRWPNLHQLISWGRIAAKLGLRSRGGRVYHPWRLAMVPQSWLVSRSVGYYSLARRRSA